jgi:hypothetical protein
MISKLDSTVKNRSRRRVGFSHTSVMAICPNQTEQLKGLPSALHVAYRCQISQFYLGASGGSGLPPVSPYEDEMCCPLHRIGPDETPRDEDDSKTLI